ncbi:MAG: phosphoenolpyruvate--protein phosphotransferase [Deltaproteobacteria bacterium]|nr:phosphoenolpyruvate--protein phosphotransferase [Deltaproteobacteria bacterium]
MTDKNPKEFSLAGSGASPGIAIGKAYVADHTDFDSVEQVVLPMSEVHAEVARFKEAVKRSEKDLGRLIKRSPKELGQQVQILEAHKALLRDKMFYGRTIETIRRGRVNAEWALKNTVDRLRSVFRKIEDAYIRDRGDDVVYVYKQVMKNLLGKSVENGVEKVGKRMILVAHDVSPAEASQLQHEYIQAFVTDRGGRTSHTSIIARALQMPSVAGLENATKKIRTGDLIIVDGTAGLVIVHPEEETLFRYNAAREQFEAAQALLARDSRFPAQTPDGFLVQVNANIELLEEVVAVMDRGGDGVGLYRTEFLYLNRKNLPAEQELYENYKEVVELLAPRPVTIRTLDINGDKVAEGIFSEEGDNPALGLRAIRFCLTQPALFRVQMKAILRASAHGYVRILFPMISTLEELLRAKELLEEAAQELRQAGEAFKPDLEVGVMIEVPSAALICDILADHVDFFSIGTNDLIQYTMAADRTNRHVAYLFNAMNPSVLRLLDRVAAVAREKNVRLAMCGEMAGDPRHVPVLLGMGFSELSMNSASIPAVKNLIRLLPKAECEAVLPSILSASDAETAADLVQEAFGKYLEAGKGPQPAAGEPVTAS